MIGLTGVATLCTSPKSVRTSPARDPRQNTCGSKPAVAAASAWALLRSRHLNAPLVDSQIAATALTHGLTLVTRNIRDFAFDGLAVFNPWHAR